VIKQIKHLLKDDGGIATGISTAFWWSPRLTPREMHDALQIRSNRLHTKCRDVKWAGAAGSAANTTCPLCRRSIDDACHALGDSCMHTDIRKLITARHDMAVKACWDALRMGKLSKLPMWTDLDLRSSLQKLQGLQRSRKLPGFLLERPAQHIIPDIVVMTIHKGFPPQDAQGRTTIEQWCKAPQDHPWQRFPEDRSLVTLHLLEVKYTYDLQVHALVQRARNQHSDLRDALLTKGWGAVEIHPIIIGAAGMMRQKTSDVLQELGVSGAELQKLLTQLSLDSIRSTSQMITMRRPTSERTRHNRARVRTVRLLGAGPRHLMTCRIQPPAVRPTGMPMTPPCSNERMELGVMT
jgi:hypothetical protein